MGQHNMGNNPMMQNRTRNINQLLDMLKKAEVTGVKHNKILAEFGIKNGSARKKTMEYYNELLDSGKIKPEVEDA